MCHRYQAWARPHGGTPVIALKIVASMMCADLAAPGREVQALEAAGIDGFHFDVMDGRFVPNVVFGPAFLAALRPLTRLPFEAHLMVADPRPLIRPLAQAGCNLCLVHAESAGDLRQILDVVRGNGMTAGIALRPDTPLSHASEALPLLDRVLVLTVPPGFAGQPMVAGAAEKVAAVASVLAAHRSQAVIAVDGNVNPLTVRPLVREGARILVGGSSGLFLPGMPFGEALRRLRAAAGDSG